MTIGILPEPDGCREAIVEALRARLERGLLAGLSAPVGVTKGLPRLVGRGRRFARATPSSWDYFVIGSNGVGMASARIEEDGPVFTSVTRGRFAEGALAALRLGEAVLGGAGGGYFPMLVESGPAAVFAVIFKPERGAGYYVDVLDGGLIDPEAMVVRRGLGYLSERISYREKRSFEAIRW